MDGVPRRPGQGVTTYIALLRGVNVGGKRPVPMAALRELGEASGLRNVRTLLNSGNMVFDDARGGTKLETMLEKAAHDALGLSTEFFIRSAAEWDAVVAGNPFGKEAKAAPAYLVLLALKAPVAAANVKALQGAIVGREQVLGEGKHVYATYPDGQGRSKLTAAVMDRVLGTRVTARNWNTVLKLAAMAHE